MGDIILTMKGIDKSFPGVHALDHVDLEVRKGEVLALMGENGAGKSTLMNILGCLDKPTSGDYILDGINISKVSIKKIPVLLHMKEKKLNSKIQEKRRMQVL